MKCGAKTNKHNETIENPETDSYIYGHFIYGKMTMSNKERIVFSINSARSIGHPYGEKKKES